MDEAKTIDLNDPPPTPKAVTVNPTQAEIDMFWSVANRMVTSRMKLPKDATTADAVFIKMLTGRELGLPMMTSIYELENLDGKMCMNSRTKVAIIRKRGIGSIELVKSTDTEAEVEVRRASWPASRVERVSWTWAKAEYAGLTGKDNWRKYGKSMLAHRVYDMACKIYFQDIFLGIADSPDEIGSEETHMPDFEGGQPATEQAVKPPWDQGTPAVTAEAPPVCTTNAEQPEELRTKLKGLVVSLSIDQQTWSGLIQRYGGAKLNDVSPENQLRLHAYLDKIHLIRRLRPIAKLSDEDWQRALNKRNVTSDLQLPEADAAAISDKLWNMATPFDRQAAGLEVKPETSTEGKA